MGLIRSATRPAATLWIMLLCEATQTLLSKDRRWASLVAPDTVFLMDRQRSTWNVPMGIGPILSRMNGVKFHSVPRIQILLGMDRNIKIFELIVKIGFVKK